MKSVQRCMALAQLLTEQNFPAIGIHRGMTQEERLSRYQQFKDFQKVSRLCALSSSNRIKLYARYDLKRVIFSAYFGGDKPVWTWNGYRTCEYCIQL